MSRSASSARAPSALLIALALTESVGLAAPTLELTGTCPGPMHVAVDAATAGDQLTFVGANGPGVTVVPSGTCAGTLLSIQGDPQIYGTVTADASGAFATLPTIPAPVCLKSLQVLDHGSCTVSNAAVPALACLDGDLDGACDIDDLCPGFDDRLDDDADGVPDGCDACPGISDVGSAVLSGPGVVEDAYMQFVAFSNPAAASWNNGGNGSISVSRTAYSDYWLSQGLLKVDLSSIPTGVTVTSAWLDLYVNSQCYSTSAPNTACTSGHVLPYNAHALRRPFGEGTGANRAALAGESSWNHSESPTSWGQGGAGSTSTDHESVAEDTVWMSGSEVDSWVSFDLTGLVQEQIDGVTPNHGVLLKGPSTPSGLHKTFTLASTDAADPGTWPQLVVEYTCSSCLDDDADGICDGVDACLGDNATGDADADGVCDDLDQCPGSDDALDADGDGQPDGCDLCPLGPQSVDADGDGVPDACDVCAGFDDALDADGDGVPDGCDQCPGQPDVVQLTLEGPALFDDTLIQTAPVADPSRAGRNFGALPTIEVMRTDYSTWWQSRSLIRVDLSSVPAGASVLDATLDLFLTEVCFTPDTNGPQTNCQGGYDYSYEFYSLLTPFGEGVKTGGNATTGEASWTDSQVPIPWAYATGGAEFPGIDRSATLDTAFSLTGVETDSWVSVDLTAAVANMHDGTIANYGWLLKGPESDLTHHRYVQIASGDNPDAAIQPKLHVTHTCVP